MRATALVVAAALLAAAGPVRAAQVTVRSGVSATHVPLGESVDWVISIEGVMGADPPVVPPLDFARADFGGSSQEMSFINGQMTARTVFQYRLTPTKEGRFALPSVRLRAGGKVYTTDPVALLVSPPQPGVAPSFGAGGARTTPRLKLEATVEPRTVVVGQPVICTIRLYQGTRLLGDPDYRGPDTPQFFVENADVGRSYYTGSGPDRWLVGERKTVLYPTTSGRLTIGPATMTCLVPDPDTPDGIQVNLATDPVPIDVRPLPPAPPGYEGAVADAALSGVVDRTTIRADESIVVTFRLAGSGNLRLAPPPGFKDLEDFDLFEKKVDDSLAVNEGRPEGTKIVRYTLLPRRPGALQLPRVSYVTYVPGEGYRTLTWAGARIDVTPGLARDSRGGDKGVRYALVPTADPGGEPWTPARPFVGIALALAGLGAWITAAARRRAAKRGGGDGGVHGAALRAAMAGLDDARRKDNAREFWRRAEDALQGLPGGDDLRARVAQARYAPGGGDAGEMARLAPELSRFLAAAAATGARARRPLPGNVRAALALCALSVVVALGVGTWRLSGARPFPGLAPQLAAAAHAVGGGQVDAGQRALVGLWNRGAHRPGVAFDLAVAAYYQKRLGEAALWTERGRRLDPRHPLASDLAQALAEQDAWAGLPTGALAATTVGELVFAALVLVALAGLALALGGRLLRPTGFVLLGLALALGGLAAREGAVGQGPGRAVIVTEAPLSDAPGGPGTVTLEAGRAVWLEGGGNGWQRIKVSPQVEGWVPTAAVQAL